MWQIHKCGEIAYDPIDKVLRYAEAIEGYVFRQNWV